MNTPVTFEIAKLLKEKEYEGETSSKEYRSLYYNIVDEKLHTWEYFQAFKNMLKAPSIAQVIMWLYEKHGIWIFCDRTTTWFWTIQKSTGEYIHHEDQEPLTDQICNGFNSPTEAYLAAIEYTLKNLI